MIRCFWAATNTGAVTADGQPLGTVTDPDAANYILKSQPVHRHREPQVADYVPKVEMICETGRSRLSMTFDYREGTTITNTQKARPPSWVDALDDDGLSWGGGDRQVRFRATRSAKGGFGRGYVAVGSEFTATVAAAGTNLRRSA